MYILCLIDLRDMINNCFLFCQVICISMKMDNNKSVMGQGNEFFADFWQQKL